MISLIKKLFGVEKQPLEFEELIALPLDQLVELAQEAARNGTSREDRLTIKKAVDQKIFAREVAASEDVLRVVARSK